MHTIRLHDFLAFLNQLSPQDFKENHVDSFVTGKALVRDDLKSFVHFRKDNYGRNLIAQNNSYELICLTWLPNQMTPIHDHCGQRCWMFIQSGHLAFKTFKPPLTDFSPLIAYGSGEVLTSPSSAYIDDGIGVHAISNLGDEPAVSIHLYAGPIPKCRVYNEKESRFEIKELGFFTRFGKQVGC